MVFGDSRFSSDRLTEEARSNIRNLATKIVGDLFYSQINEAFTNFKASIDERIQQYFKAYVEAYIRKRIEELVVQAMQNSTDQIKTLLFQSLSPDPKGDKKNG